MNDTTKQDILEKLHRNNERMKKISDDPDLAVGSDLSLILGFSLVGIAAGVLGLLCAKGDPLILFGCIMFLAGYTVLMIRMMPFFLIGGGIIIAFGSNGASLGIAFASIALGVGFLVIRYHVPRHLLKKVMWVSWCFMFVGPAIMCLTGAPFTGAACGVASGLWAIVYLIKAGTDAAAGKVSDAVGALCKQGSGNTFSYSALQQTGKSVGSVKKKRLKTNTVNTRNNA